jgi:uncharacterized protein YggE
MQRVRLLISCFAVLSFSLFGNATKAAETPGIAVTGAGRVVAKPSMVELAAVVKGEAELAGDAITKYQGNKRRALETIQNLQIANLKVEDGGVSINSADGGNAMMAAMRGMPVPENTTQKLSLSEPLTLRLTGIDKLSTEELLETLVKIVDAGKDAGMVIGPPSKSMYELQIAAQMGQSTESALAAFKLEGVDQLKQQAYQAAIADARKQAERLAELAGVKLGKVISIRETPAGDSSQPRYNPYYGYMMTSSSDGTEKQYVSSGLTEITVSVVLHVEFAIE